MKKNFKLVLALALSIMMVLGSVAFAADGDHPKDTSVKIMGLDEGDIVNLYQVLKWVDGEGWKLCPGFEGLSSNENITKIINNTKGTIELTKADLEAITNAAKAAVTAGTSGLVTTSGTVGTGEDSYTNNVDVGMWLALVEPVNSDTVYNPIIVSADFSDTPNTSEIDASSAMMGTSTVAKKKTVDVEKVAEDKTLNVGDPVKFTITTTIPAFSNSYTDPHFTLTDTMQAGTALKVDATNYPFTVSAGDVTYTYASGSATEPATDQTTFTLTFDSTKIAGLVAPQEVTITYYAYITDVNALTNIVEKPNDVEVNFSNNPKDDQGHGHLYDEERVYTFSIDAGVLGFTSYKTGEIVKVGLDQNGNQILESKELSNTSSHEALAGAKFKLYTKDGSNYTEYNNPALTAATSSTDGYIVSDADGLMYIPGLDEGTYYIHEEDAPDGYIKDPAYHAFTISVTEWGTETLTKTFDDGCETTYEVKYVKSYKVEYEGGATSSYTFTNEGPTISRSVIGDSSNEIVNTKGVELPSTGGIGTTIFYVGGSLMVLAAAILLITKRRMGVED